MNPDRSRFPRSPAFTRLQAALARRSQASLQMEQLLKKIPPADRHRFARNHLNSELGHVATTFAGILPGQLSRSILFVSTQPHDRVTRLAAAARLAGWEPILLHVGNLPCAAKDSFRLHQSVSNLSQLVLGSWLFPGPLIHVFAQNGASANLLCLTKNRPLVLDLEDTCTGWHAHSDPAHLWQHEGVTSPAELHACQAALAAECQKEKEAIAAADGLTHRDLRLSYLHRHHGFALASQNLFVPDPLLEPPPMRTRHPGAKEIRVLGFAPLPGGESGMARLARALCNAGIHLHVRLNPEQQADDPGMEVYRQLAHRSLYFHLEPPESDTGDNLDRPAYDFGLVAHDRLVYGDPLLRHSDDYEWGGGSSHLTIFLQMNLGVIVPPALRFQSFWARHFAPALVTGSPDFFRYPRPVLEAALATSAAAPGKNLASVMADAVAPRLHRFYSALSARTPARRRRRAPLSQPPPPPSSHESIGIALQEGFRTLVGIPVNERAAHARARIDPEFAAKLTQTFQSIPAERLAKTVLFVAVQPHARDARLAEAARLAGWDTLLVHLGKVKYQADQYYRMHAAASSWNNLVYATWLFPGALVHVFSLNGSLVEQLCRTKNKPVILDLYDACSGTVSSPVGDHAAECRAIALADGLTHRDLRLKYLQQHHRWVLPPCNIFIPDPPSCTHLAPVRTRPEGEIRVVSAGWVTTHGDNSISQAICALCAHRIHVHVYIAHVQSPDDPEIIHYRRLEKESTYFHLEKAVHGDAYWTELQRYDFGLAAFDGFILRGTVSGYTDDYIRGCGSSRISDYIATNIGIIISPEIRFQSYMARRYAPVVVNGTKEFFANPRPVLEAALRIRASHPPKNRAAIAIPAVAPRLGRFYESVVAASNYARTVSPAVSRPKNHAESVQVSSPEPVFAL